MSDAFRQTFVIRADHPALPGHFPGDPIVPGVVLLDRVSAACEAWCGRTPTTWPQAKFLAPLRPGEPAQIVLTRAGSGVRFSIERDSACIASGSFECGESA